MVTTRSAIESTISHGSATPVAARPSIMNGLRNGTWVRTTIQPARMSSRPIAAYTPTM